MCIRDRFRRVPIAASFGLGMVEASDGALDRKEVVYGVDGLSLIHISEPTRPY